ncbi:MAG: PAS domain-containing protein [Janthinobacterium lividum]|jgi:signal transduction histidine kinase
MTPAVPLADLFTSEDLFATLEVSLTGINLLRPVYEPDGATIVDFALEYINPAGQRMTGLSEQPGGTLLGRFPHTLAEGIFQYYQRVFETGEQLTYHTNYQADGLDNFFQFSARRSGAHLVASFTDTSDQDRSAVELALRESQAAEQVARAEAEQQRQRLAQLVEQAPASIALLHGPDHVIEVANAGFQQLFGHRPLVGKRYREALPELANQSFVDLLDEVYRTGHTYRGLEEVAYIDRTNSGHPEELYFNYIYQATRNAAGQVEGILIFAYEVTGQVRARQQVQDLNEELAATNEELRASNEEYQQANMALVESRQQVQHLNQELEARVQERTHQLEAAQATTERQRQQWQDLFLRAPASICIFDGPEWVYEFVNPGYQAMFPGRELLGKRLVDALPEVADQPLMAILHRVYDTGEPFQESEVLVPLARTEGGPIEDIYFDLTYLARYSEAGQIDGFVTYAYDVTEQVLARRARETQRQELQRLFLEAPAAICILQGPELVYEFLNPRYQQFFPDRQLLGKSLRDALPELADHAAYHTMRHVFDSGETVWQQALHVPLKRTEDGVLEDRYFNYIQQPRYDEQGRIDGVLVFGFEVTELVEMRQQVERLNQELAAINAELTATNQELGNSNAQLTRTNVELDTFVYTASHDLKAPITNIESITLALRDTLPPDVQQDEMIANLLDLLAHTTTRFQATIGQLTDLSKLQLAYAGPAESVNLAATVESVRLDLVPVLTQANAHLTVEVAPDLLVSFSPANLRSAIYNLLSNAVKYRALDRPAQVRVRAFLAGSRVVLEVQDNGLGMSAVQQRQLFGLFQRLHTHVEGSGVGLYITKRLVENGGGTIAVQSQVDVGTTFTLTFPA